MTTTGFCETSFFESSYTTGTAGRRCGRPIVKGNLCQNCLEDLAEMKRRKAPREGPLPQVGDRVQHSFDVKVIDATSPEAGVSYA